VAGEPRIGEGETDDARADYSEVEASGSAGGTLR